MNAPNREEAVRAITFAEATLPFTSEETRREFLVGILIPRLNVLDGGKWGRLIKTDQGGKIPADIIVWADTLQHFDVLTDSGPMWEDKGVVTNPAWEWGPVGAIPYPTPTPTTGTSPSNADLRQEIINLRWFVETTLKDLSDDINDVLRKQDRPLKGGNWRTGSLEFKP